MNQTSPSKPRTLLNRALRSQLLARLTYPHGVDRFIEQVDPTLVIGPTVGRITAIEHPTARSVRIRVTPNANWQGFAAGQYVELGIEINGRRERRCFSPAQSQHLASGELEFTMAVQPQGRVTGYLKNQASAGMTVWIGPASGVFHLPAARPERLLLISAGSGITPVIAMLRTLQDESYSGRISFIHYAPRRSEELYPDALEVLAQDMPNLDLHVLHPEEGDPLFSREQLCAMVPDFSAAQTYVCGPQPLLQATTALWEQDGIAERLHQEAYGVAKPAADAPIEGEVRFARSERLMTNSGATLLEQAESLGLRPQAGCRMGICHTCTCRKTSGQVRDLRSGQISEAGEQDIQICVSVPVGTVTLDI